MYIRSNPLNNLNPPSECLYLMKEVDKYYGMIGGGAARQIYLQDNSYGSTDIDLYFPSRKHANNYIHDLCDTTGTKKVEETSPYKYNSRTALTYQTKYGKVQIVHKNAYNERHMFDDFDFHCCCFCIRYGSLYYTSDAVEDVANKKLRATASGNIHAYRIIKYYLQYGYEPADDKISDIFDHAFKNFIKEKGSSDIQIEEFISKGFIIPDYSETVYPVLNNGIFDDRMVVPEDYVPQAPDGPAWGEDAPDVEQAAPQQGFAPIPVYPGAYAYGVHNNAIAMQQNVDRAAARGLAQEAAYERQVAINAQQVHARMYNRPLPEEVAEMQANIDRARHAHREAYPLRPLADNLYDHLNQERINNNE